MNPALQNRFADIAPGETLPGRVHQPTMAELFLYSAAIWNPHRIHYDLDYVTREESYPGILITGPLQGDWLCQLALEWLGGDGALEWFRYSNRQAAYLGETLHAGGEVASKENGTGRVRLALHLTNEAGNVVTPGEAVVCFAGV